MAGAPERHETGTVSRSFCSAPLRETRLSSTAWDRRADRDAYGALELSVSVCIYSAARWASEKLPPECRLAAVRTFTGAWVWAKSWRRSAWDCVLTHASRPLDVIMSRQALDFSHYHTHINTVFILKKLLRLERCTAGSSANITNISIRLDTEYNSYNSFCKD